MTRRHLSIAVLMLALACSARAREFDAESDLGLVAENSSPAVAARNTAQLTAALNAQWTGGQFTFADGHVGPVLYPVRCAAKEFFFAGTISTSKRIGGALFGMGSRGYPMTTEQYNHGSLGGATTRFTRIDGKEGGAVLRLRGHGFRTEGIEYRGRPYLTDSTGEGPQSGTKTPVGIEVEGRASPATGGHIIRDCAVSECNYGICALAGHYEDVTGKFIGDENHADNGIVDGVSFHNCDSCFRSENQQALIWSLRDIAVGGWGGRGLAPTVVCDIVRGGNVWIDGLSLNHGQATLFKVRDYSPNTQQLTCHNLKWDTFSGPDYYLTLFQYDGPVHAGDDMSWVKWTVRVTGHIANSDTAPKYDDSKLVVIPDASARVGIQRSDLLFDVARLPLTNFISAGGPWVRPK